MIRSYRPEDIDRVMEVWYQASLIAHPFLGAEFLETERKAIIEQHMPVAEVYVYARDGVVLGFIALLDHEVGAIFVEPKHQGQGIGCALMDHARQLKGDLELDVFKKNRIGRRFYDRYGFEFVEEVFHEDSGQPQLRLRLPAG